MSMTISGSTPTSTAASGTSSNTSGAASANASSSSASTKSTYGTAAQAAAQSAMTALGAGSGINIQQLAQSLTEAEKAPQMSLLDRQLSKAQASLAAYSTLTQGLSNLQSAIASLQDNSNLASTSVQNSQASAVQITATGAAVPGNHTLQVLATAAPQQFLTGGFADPATNVSASSPVTLTLDVNGQVHAFTPPSGSASSLNEFAARINAAGLGVTAQVFNSGQGSTPYKLLISSSSTGASSAFSATATDSSGNAVAGFSFDKTSYDSTTGGQLTAAADAHVVVDGVDLWRASNSITDALPGVTLNVLTATSSAGGFQLNRDTSTLTANIQNLVTAYNDIQTVLQVATDPKSTVPTLGASLVADSLVGAIQTQLSAMVSKQVDLGGSVGNMSLRDLGITHNIDGTLSLNNTKLASTLQANYTNVAQFLTNGKDNSQGARTDTARGFAGNWASSLTTMISGGTDAQGNLVTSPIKTATTNLNATITTVQKNETTLNTRMTDLYNRYLSQFTTMDTLVSQMNSTRTWLNQLYNPPSKTN